MADGSAIGTLVARFQPDLILHAAALARPQQMRDAGALQAVNVDGSGHLARAASARGIPLVYLSTDLVYPADAGLCNERTAVAPSGAGDYSRSKYLGEEAVRSSGGPWIIIRPSLLFGNGTHRSGSFTQFLDRTWDEGGAAPVFTDQYRSFLYVGDLITAVEQVAIRRRRWNEMFVCGGMDRLSRAEFGVRYARARGKDDSVCRQMRAAELEGYVGGPSDITLDTTKLREAGWVPRPLATSFSEMLRERAGE